MNYSVALISVDDRRSRSSTSNRKISSRIGNIQIGEVQRYYRCERQNVRAIRKIDRVVTGQRVGLHDSRAKRGHAVDICGNAVTEIHVHRVNGRVDDENR